jgi:capsular exopolysaccharide synthesis family protein
VLGRIPFDNHARTRPLLVSADPNSIQAEAYRQLRTNLQFVAGAGRGRTVLVTSSIPGEGKSASAVNLAISLAEAGSRVCLVEADLRRPGVGRYLDLESTVGLTTVLIGAVDLADAVQPWGSGRLDVLMSGQRPPNPSEMLSGPGMGELLDSLQEQYDMVIIDGAPLLPVTDSAVLARRCAAVVVVVGAGQVRRKELHRSLSDLETIGANVVGVLLTKVPTKGPDGAGIKAYAYEATAESDFKSAERVTKKAKKKRDRSDKGTAKAVANTGVSRHSGMTQQTTGAAGDLGPVGAAQQGVAHAERSAPALHR